MAALFAIPASAGLVLVSDHLVTVLLGPRWADAAGVIQLCAISGGFCALYSIFGNLLVVLGRLNMTMWATYTHALLFVALLSPVVRHYGILGAAGLKGALAGATFVLYSRALGASSQEMVAVLGRPIGSTILMACACVSVDELFSSPAAALVCQIAVGALSYGLAAGAIWAAAGRPDGAERDFVEIVLDRVRSVFATVSTGLRCRY